MYDQTLVQEILIQIAGAIKKINRRFKPIKSSNDFLINDAGVDKLDAICMMLIAIGENIKKLDKVTGGTLLSQYPAIDWKGAKGIRDIISHHYFDINAEIIFSVCDERLEEIEKAVKAILSSLE